MSRLNNLSTDLINKILEYENPYKTYFSKNVVRDEIWKGAWKMWYENGQLASCGNYQPATRDDTLTLKLLFYFI